VTLTKSTIIGKISEQMEYTVKESSAIFEECLSIVKSTLEAGEDVKITGFGSFVVKQKHERRGRNPQTGASLMLPPRRIVNFKLSGKLNDQINGD